MRIFRPEIETALKIMGIAALISLILLPATWGYEQRQQARNWQNVACAYRIKEVARQTRMIATVDHRRDACVTPARRRASISPALSASASPVSNSAASRRRTSP